MRCSVFFAAVLALAGCNNTSSTDSGPGPGTDGGTDAFVTPTVDGGHDTGPVGLDGGDDAGHSTPDANVDANTVPGCGMDFAVCGAAGVVDHTGDTAVTIGFGTGFTYDPPCIRIHPGTMVTLPGSTVHPLINASCSPTSSPVPTTASTTGGAYTFTAVGNYGYQCMVHAGFGMKGLIIVE